MIRYASIIATIFKFIIGKVRAFNYILHTLWDDEKDIRVQVNVAYSYAIIDEAALDVQ